MATKTVEYNGEKFTYKTTDDIRVDFDSPSREKAQMFIEYLMSIGYEGNEIRFAPYKGVDYFHYCVIVF